MAVSLEQFQAQLSSSGLMSADEVDTFIASLGNDQQPADAEALAKLLVEKKQLTPFQAQQIWQGKGKHLVLGNYVIVEKLGQGGMGMVLKATHKLMKRDVALKVLSPQVVKDQSAVQRFLREVEAAAKLTHPNIVAAHDADQANGAYFLIMEYVEGRDLSILVKKQGPTSIAQAVDFILQAARGLEYAHQNGVVHRDIKPANLLLDNSGTVKVLDMGLARIEDGGADAATQAALTGTGTIMGTVDYMAPEQAEDTKSAGPQADIYSLGASLYFLLTGKSMVTGTAIGKKLKMLMTGEGLPDSMTGLRSEVSAEVDVVFRKMTAFDMADRYQTMTEVIADLEAIKAGGVPSSATTPGIQPVVGRSEDSAMQSFLNKLGDGTVTTGPTVMASPRTEAGAETMASSVDEATRPAFKQTATFTKTVMEPKNRKLLIGGGVAACLLVGAIIWGMNSGGDTGKLGNTEVTGTGPSKKPPPSTQQTATASSHALSFENADTYVVCRTVSLDRTKPYTLEAWIRARAIQGNIISFNRKTFPRLAMLESGKTLVFEQENYRGARKGGVPLDEWCHVAGVQDRDEARLYLNGKLMLQSDVAILADQPSPAEELRIGGLMNFFGEFQGDIDEVRVSTSARYTKAFAPRRHFKSDESTLVLYHIDEGDGNSLHDSSGNRHNAFISGAEWVRSDESSNSAPPFALAPFNEVEAKAHQAVWAMHLGLDVEKEVALPGGAKMKFVLIPPGEFMMGSNDEDVERLLAVARADSDDAALPHIQSEAPRHRVRISRPFYLGKYEVTQSQWKAMTGKAPSLFKDKPNHPVEQVSWKEVWATIQKWNGNVAAGLGKLSLPTEAQWEYACRGGTESAWHCGDKETDLKDFGWFKLNADGSTHPVGQLQPNAFGLYDMHGNVYEWCIDQFESNSYANAIATDPVKLGNPAGGGYRIRRGGCIFNNAQTCRSAARHHYSLHRPYSHIGFRLVLAIDTTKIGRPRPTELTPLDLPNGEPGEALRIPHNVIQHPNSNHLGFLSDKLVLTASTNGTPTTFRLRDGVPQRKLERAWFDEGKVGAIRFAQSRNHLFGGLSDGRACLWDIESGKIEKYFGEPAEATQDNKTIALSVSSDGKSVAVTQPHGLVRVWDVETGRQIGSREKELQVRCAFLPGSQKLGLLSGTQLAIWDVANDQIEKTYPHGLPASTDFRISPDGRYAIACDGRRPAAFCLNLQTGDVRQFSSPDAPAYFSTISPDSRWLYAGGILYDLDTLQSVLDLTKEANGNPDSSWRQVTYAPDGRFLVVHVYSEEKSKQGIVFWRLPEKFWPRGMRREVSVPPPANAPFNQAQAKAHQRAWAQYLKIPVEHTNSIGMKFVLIPPGEFVMGGKLAEVEETIRVSSSDRIAAEYLRSEIPQHKVVLTRPFYLGVTEVTQAQYAKIMGRRNAYFSSAGLGKEAVAGLETIDFPMEMAKWSEVAEFCAKLSQREELKPFYLREGENEVKRLEGTGYRLPSEAEWEFACRAGSVTNYWYGDDDKQFAEYGWSRLNSGERPHAVGKLKANPFGLFDIHGNVAERVEDSWEKSYYEQFHDKAAVNPQGPAEAGLLQVSRGGHWNALPFFSRSSRRFAFRASGRAHIIGFRVVLSVAAEKSGSSESADERQTDD